MHCCPILSIGGLLFMDITDRNLYVWHGIVLELIELVMEEEEQVLGAKDSHLLIVGQIMEILIKQEDYYSLSN